MSATIGADNRSCLRLAVCHPRLGRGGSEARAVFLLEALSSNHDVDLITVGPVDWSALNAYYGASVDPDSVRVRRPGLVGRAVTGLPAARLRGVVHGRHVWRHAAEYDLVLSAYNPLPLPMAGVKFVADFTWDDGLRSQAQGETARPLARPRRSGVLAGLYRTFLRAYTPRRDRAAVEADDVIVANSRFAAEMLASARGLEVDHVIHPPVQGPVGGEAVEGRVASFVSLGRIAPEKRLEDQIRILTAVRARGHDVALDVVGGDLGAAYARRLRAEHDAPWITWHGWLQGEAKWGLLQTRRFGLHTCRGEAFGIGVAEMARAGVIVFAPDVGGPVEILDAPALCFGSPEDAVDRILAVLEAPDQQRVLSDHLVEAGRRFGVERFMAASRALVADLLQP